LNDEQFTAVLAANGLRVKTMEGDGNCLFRSIADQLYGDASRHVEVRAAVVEYMRTRKDYFKLFLDEDEEDVDEYLDQMSRSGEWGGNHELYAASETFSLAIYVYQNLRSNSRYLVQPALPETGGKKKGKKAVSLRAIGISYHGDVHYNSVRLMRDPDAHGVPALGAELPPVPKAAEGDEEGEGEGEEGDPEEAEEAGSGSGSGSSSEDEGEQSSPLDKKDAIKKARDEKKNKKEKEKLRKMLLKMKERASSVLALAIAASLSKKERRERRKREKAIAKAEAEGLPPPPPPPSSSSQAPPPPGGACLEDKFVTLAI
jgi:hypothetical protein